MKKRGPKPALETEIESAALCRDAATNSHVVGAAAGGAAAPSPVGVEEFAARFVHAFVGVRAEVIVFVRVYPYIYGRILPDLVL